MAEQQQVQRLLDLYVDQLQGDAERLDEVLLVRLRYYDNDIRNVIDRLVEDPSLATALVHNLSAAMQQLDTDAGRVDQAHATASAARRWVLMIPETANHEDAEGGDKSRQDR